MSNINITACLLLNMNYCSIMESQVYSNLFPHISIILQQQSTFPVYHIQFLSTPSSFTLIYNYQEHITLQSHLSIFQVNNYNCSWFIFQMSLSIFSYIWENVISVIKNIYSILNYKKFHLWYIHYGLHFIVKISLFNIPYWLFSNMQQNSWKKRHWLYVQHELFIHWTYTRKTYCLFNKPKEGENFMFPYFDNEFLFSLKIFKIDVKHCVFPNKQNDMCYYNFQCFISVGLIIDGIIMIFFMHTAEKNVNKVNNLISYKIKHDKIYL